MKNQSILFIAVVNFFLTTTIAAQPNKFEAGIEGGGSLRFLWGNALVRLSNNAVIGFAGGAAFQYNFPKYFSIRTSLLFERKGNGSKGTALNYTGGNEGTYTLRSNFDYLTLPVLFRASFGKKVKYFVNAGPYFGYLIKETYKIKGTNIPSTSTENTNYFQRPDVGLTAGIGFSAPLTKVLALSFELRNNLGLYNISKLQVYSNGTLNTNSTNLLVGLAYKFGARSETAK